jgi:hypothetical protein
MEKNAMRPVHRSEILSEENLIRWEWMCLPVAAGELAITGRRGEL